MVNSLIGFLVAELVGTSGGRTTLIILTCLKSALYSIDEVRGRGNILKFFLHFIIQV